jgi:D-arabinose 5-phosphate isomerase GutQ
VLDISIGVPPMLQVATVTCRIVMRIHNVTMLNYYNNSVQFLSGAVFEGDIIILISKSGASEELLSLVPCAKVKGAYLISLTSVEGNPLSKLCDVNVHLPIQGEICPFNLAPVTSAAVQMLFGDTIVAAVMSACKVARNHYATNHPAGKIGKSLIFKVMVDASIDHCQ